jgi:hypothetical protein
MSDWRAYVHAVAARYAGRIAAYEVWNEAETCGFYCGSPARLAAMAHAARAVVRTVDPAAVMLAPSTVPRWLDLPRWGTRWWVEAYNAAGGYRWADLVSVHGYASKGDPPEVETKLIDHYRSELAKLGVRLPIRNTEINYDTNTGAPTTLTVRMQSAYVVRTYLLSWAHGVIGVDWYDWSATPNIGVRMTRRTGSVRAAPPARAFDTVRRWMAGRMSGCTVTRAGVHSCRIEYAHSTGLVMWSPARSVMTPVPACTTVKSDMYGRVTPVTRDRVRVDFAPRRFTCPGR